MARKRRVNICGIIEMLMVVFGIIYVIAGTILKLHMNWGFRVVFVVWAIIYIIISDFIEPKVMDRFKRKKKVQINAYYKYAVLDMIGVLGIAWFACCAGMLNDFTHYAGIAIFAVTFVPKKSFYKKYAMRSSYFEDEEEDDDFDISDL